MAKNEVGEFDEVDANNLDVQSISLAENVMRPPAVNNAFRAVMGALKRWFKTSLFRLRDSTDQTKLLALDLSGLTTATTRTLIVPDASGTLNLINTAQTISAIKTFSAIPLMSGGGVKFPAAAVASADANTLDDYQEGTWTPELTGAGVAGAGTYSTQTGVYTIIGRMVFFRIALVWSAHTGSGASIISLPFAGVAGTGTASVGYDVITYANTPFIITDPANSRLFPRQAASNSIIAAINIEADGAWYINGHYELV